MYTCKHIFPWFSFLFPNEWSGAWRGSTTEAWMELLNLWLNAFFGIFMAIVWWCGIYHLAKASTKRRKRKKELSRFPATGKWWLIWQTIESCSFTKEEEPFPLLEIFTRKHIFKFVKMFATCKIKKPHLLSLQCIVIFAGVLFFKKQQKCSEHSPVPIRWFPLAKPKLECPSPWPLPALGPFPRWCTQCHRGLLATTHLRTCPRWSIETSDRARLCGKRHRKFYEPMIR